VSPGEAVGRAAAQLTVATGPQGLCKPFVEAFAVSGAVISTLGDPLGSQTVCASDAVAARIDEIQIDLGEGPCWNALHSRRPVLEQDRQRLSSDWPAAHEALEELHLGALFAFPLHVGDLAVGSLDLYSTARRRLTPVQVQDITALASIAARQVLRRALAELVDGDDGISDGRFSRREVHQASGMVAAQLRIGVDDALVVLRAHAFAHGRSVRDVAGDVVERRLVFRS
jgi:GAF domain-containing protein/ANTAR domain-containing protein